MLLSAGLMPAEPREQWERLQETRRHSKMERSFQPHEAVRKPRYVVDGRIRRGNQTRMRIVTAYLDVVRRHEQGGLFQKVSEDAGCSLRTVFQHFADEPTLYKAALDLIYSQLKPPISFDPGDGSRSTRIRAYVETKAKDCVQLLPLRMLLHMHFDRPNHVDPRAVALRCKSRALLEWAFGPELRSLPNREQEQTLIALELLTNVESWLMMRKDLRLGIRAVKAAWIDAINRLLPKRLEDWEVARFVGSGGGFPPPPENGRS